MNNIEDFIFVGSYEKRWKYFNWKYGLATDSCLVNVNYSAVLDELVEELVMFDDVDERLVINRLITITDFEQQVVATYSEFIVHNINLLRGD